MQDSDRVNQWLAEYAARQRDTYSSLPLDQVAEVIERLRVVHVSDGQVFVFGNGGSAANATHFVTDLGKGASDAIGSRFRVMSLNENTGWMTAIGNDYSYDDLFVRQLENYARPGDMALCMSVSGNSPNLLRAVGWARENGLVTVALLGGKRGKLADVAEHALIVPDTHYGRVEDAHMTICHMLAYAFMEAAVAVGDQP